MDTYPFRNYVWGEDREWEYLRRKIEYQKDFNNFAVGLPTKKYSLSSWFNLPHHPVIITINNDSLILANPDKGIADYIRMFKSLSEKWHLHGILISPNLPYDAMLDMCKSACEKEGRPFEYPNIFVSDYGKVMHLNAVIWPDHIKLTIPRNPRNIRLISDTIEKICRDLKNKSSGRLHEDKFLQELKVYDLRKNKVPFFYIAAQVYKNNLDKGVKRAKKAYERASREIDGRVDELAQIDGTSVNESRKCEICPDAGKCRKLCPEVEKQLLEYDVTQQHLIPKTPIGFDPSYE